MTHLKEGDKAPNFSAYDQSGEKFNLTDLLGSKVIIYFYPRDNTPTCTVEACNFRDNYQDLKKLGFEILGVSTDTQKSHLKFQEKFDLPFRLLADPDKEIVNTYGVFGPKKFMGREFDGTHRVTFIIDEKGIIQKIIKKVKSKNATGQILDEIATP